MSIRVQDPVDHYKLVSFCTLCAIAVQGDRVEATRVAGGDVERAIRDKAAQNGAAQAVRAVQEASGALRDRL
jgi:hypothetical protein